jgi:hypothetical protein
MGFIGAFEYIVLILGGLFVLFFGLVTIAVAVFGDSIIGTIIGILIIVFSFAFLINQKPEITD